MGTRIVTTRTEGPLWTEDTIDSIEAAINRLGPGKSEFVKVSEGWLINLAHVVQFVPDVLPE